MKRVIHLIYMLLTISNLSFSQNIFDLNNSVKYAEHLFKTGDYSSAAKEYERLTILVPDSSEYSFLLLQSYKHSKQIDKGKEKAVEIFGNEYVVYPHDVIYIYLQFLILQDNYSECHKILKTQTKLTIEEHQEFTLALYLLEKQTDSAGTFINTTFCSKNTNEENSISDKFSELTSLFYTQKKVKYKKPVVASLLSTVLPGLGKIYTNDIKNGLGVLSIISLYSWQSYRGFKHEGVKSFYGWSFGALATGFYIGNVYGSHQSAVRENEFQNKNIAKEVKKIIAEN